MQIEKALIDYRLRVSKVARKNMNKYKTFSVCYLC